MNKNYTILIVDDIEENIDILERQLTKEDFNVITVNEGPKALHAIKNNHIDLILLDINMPVLDGITLLTNIRNDESLSHISILMVTANDDINTALACLKKGACGYITKPFSMEQLKKQIEHCFRKAGI